MRTSLTVVVGTLLLGMLALPARGQQPTSTDSTDLINGYEQAAHSSFVGVPTDWTSHHLIFSAPEPGSDAEDKAQQDPRYWLQQLRHNQHQSDDSFATDDGVGALPDKKKKKKKNKKTKKPQPIEVDKDWSVSLGAGGTVGAGFFPAKFGFGTTGESCNDYVVYNTSLAGLSAVAATGTGTFANNISVAGNTVTINGVALTATGVGTDTITGEPTAGSTTVVGTVTYTWTTTTCNLFTPTATTGCVVRVPGAGNTDTEATNLQEAITNTCSAVTACKVSAANPGATAVIASGTGSTTSQVVVTNTSASALTFTGASNQTVTPASITVASTSGTNFALNSNTTTAATNLKTAINNNAGTNVTATSTTNVVNVTATTGGAAGNSIATTDTMTGFSWGGTTLAGGTNGQASIVAFNNLYVGEGCGGTNPTTDWAYNTGGTVVTSAVLSLDGTQVAFVHTPSLITSASSLEILRPVAGQGTVLAPATPGTMCTTGSCYTACKAGAGSCLLTLTFSVGHNDPHSSPYYDYTPGSDTLYVGDAPEGNTPVCNPTGTTTSCAFLHQFTGVFNGTPVESSTNGWPVVVASAPLAGPVYNAGIAYVSDDYDGHGNGPRLHSVDTLVSPVTVAASVTLGPTSGATVLPVDAVIVDPGASREYEFLGNDSPTNGAGNSAVYQFTTDVTVAPVETTVGTGSTTGVPVFSGAFDNTYFTSANGASPTGNLYVCGNSGGDPTLYQVPITANTMSGTSVVVAAVGGTSGTQCSQVTEIYNPNATPGTTPPNPPFDFLLFSVAANGSATGCAGGACVMNSIVTQWQASHVYTLGQEIMDNRSQYHIQRVTTAGTSGPTVPATWNHAGGVTTDGTVHWTDEGLVLATANSTGLPAAGGTSGIVVDNVLLGTGFSQFYYSNLANSTGSCGTAQGCAVQASQLAP